MAYPARPCGPAVPLDSPPLLFNSYYQKRKHDEQVMRDELDYLTGKRANYLELSALAEAERDDSMTTAARRATLQRQIIALDDKIFNIDKRMDKLRFQLNPYIPA